MNNLKEVLANNKTIGYSCIIKEEEKTYIIEYALKKDKETDLYLVYFFKIDESKMAVPEDYAFEELKKFSKYDEAIDYLSNKKCDIGKLKTMKGSGPPI